MTILEGIAAAKAALDVTKVIDDLVNRPTLDVVAVRTKVHEMLIHLVNTQSALSSVQVEIMELRQQLDNRQERSGTRSRQRICRRWWLYRSQERA